MSVVRDVEFTCREIANRASDLDVQELAEALYDLAKYCEQFATTADDAKKQSDAGRD